MGRKKAEAQVQAQAQQPTQTYFSQVESAIGREKACQLASNWCPFSVFPIPHEPFEDCAGETPKAETCQRCWNRPTNLEPELLRLELYSNERSKACNDSHRE